MRLIGRRENSRQTRLSRGSPRATAVAAALLMVAPMALRAQSASAADAANRAAGFAVTDPRPAGVIRSNERQHAREAALGVPGTEGFSSAGWSDYANGVQLERLGRQRTSTLQAPVARASWLAPLASAVVPGAGQALLRQQRSLAYVVAESFLVIRTVQSHKDYRNARDRYRELAADVARAGFGAVRPVGPWEYYEEMKKYESSGVFSFGGPGQLIPETDVTTFNGAQWLLAREQFWANADVPPSPDKPEFKRALDYYESRAVKDSFRWSWRDQTLALSEFRERINESNNSNQRYVTAFGFVAANHLVSLVDAYITVRLRRYGGAGLGAASLNTTLLPMGPTGERGYGMAMSVTIPVAGMR